MPTRSTTPTTSVTSLTEVLKGQLAASTSAMIYVPLEDGDPPTDTEIKALAGNGLHVEFDAVRNALAVRAATDDEIAEVAAQEPVSEPESA